MPSSQLVKTQSLAHAAPDLRSGKASDGDGPLSLGDLLILFGKAEVAIPGRDCDGALGA